MGVHAYTHLNKTVVPQKGAFRLIHFWNSTSKTHQRLSWIPLHEATCQFAEPFVRKWVKEIAGTFDVTVTWVSLTQVTDDMVIPLLYYTWYRDHQWSSDRFTVRNQFKVFRYSFSEAIPIFSIALKVILSLSDRFKIFTNDWL